MLILQLLLQFGTVSTQKGTKLYNSFFASFAFQLVNLSTASLPGDEILFFRTIRTIRTICIIRPYRGIIAMLLLTSH